MNKDNDLDFAEIDLEREKRTGFPEVIYGETKTPDQSAKIAKKIYDKSDIFLITRTDSKTYNQVKKLIPEANFDRSAKLIWATRKPKIAPVPEVKISLQINATTPTDLT